MPGCVTGSVTYIGQPALFDLLGLSQVSHAGSVSTFHCWLTIQLNHILVLDHSCGIIWFRCSDILEIVNNYSTAERQTPCVR